MLLIGISRRSSSLGSPARGDAPLMSKVAGPSTLSVLTGSMVPRSSATWVTASAS